MRERAQLVTIKVTARFRRWLKTRAAERERPMYEVLEQLVIAYQRPETDDADPAPPR